jgi:hypothetical protein
MEIIKALCLFLRTLVVSRATLAAENLALHHQLIVLQHSVKRPKLRPRDRLFWVWLACLWPYWRSSLRIVQPDTVAKATVAKYMPKRHKPLSQTWPTFLANHVPDIAAIVFLPCRR